jgi:hypothetical protein
MFLNFLVRTFSKVGSGSGQKSSGSATLLLHTTFFAKITVRLWFAVKVKNISVSEK